jgi:hypothetical protein
VYSNGIVLLAVIAAAILIAFGGITDRLIPLFAVGAFLAFTLSQAGMVMHWRRHRGAHALHSLVLNAVGALATLVTLCIIAASKFTEGAWVTLVIIPGLVLLFWRVRQSHERISRERIDPLPLDVTNLAPPIVVVPLHRLDAVAHKALRLALTLSPEVRAVQVLTEDMKLDDLSGRWNALVEEPARKAGLTPPSLVVLPSEYRVFFGPFLAYLRKLSTSEPDRPVTVLVPELVRRRWYHFFVQSRATLLKALLLLEGGPQISVLNTPWYLADEVDGRTLSRRPRGSWKRPRNLRPARA